MASVEIGEEVGERFVELKERQDYRYIILRISDDFNSILVEKTAPRCSSYQDFVNDLPKDDCRWAVFDYETPTDNGIKNNLCLWVWAPDIAKIKSKMIYCCAKDSLKKQLKGIHAEFGASDRSELDEELVKDNLEYRTRYHNNTN